MDIVENQLYEKDAEIARLTAEVEDYYEMNRRNLQTVQRLVDENADLRKEVERLKKEWDAETDAVMDAIGGSLWMDEDPDTPLDAIRLLSAQAAHENKENNDLRSRLETLGINHTLQGRRLEKDCTDAQNRTIILDKRIEELKVERSRYYRDYCRLIEENYNLRKSIHKGKGGSA